MSTQVELRGQLSVGGGCDPCGAGGQKVQSIALRCGASHYEAVVSTEGKMPVQTAGLIGSAWVDVPVTQSLEQIELLMVQTNAPMRLRVGAGEAALVSVGGVFPTGFGGGETLDLDLDDVEVNVVFTGAAETAQQVANEINAAAAIAGLAYQPASVSNGQVRIAGQATGSQGSVLVTGGTAQAALGFADGVNDTAEGIGSDVDIYGLYLAEYGRGQPSAPARVQVSGIGSVEVFAAGTSA